MSSDPASSPTVKPTSLQGVGQAYLLLGICAVLVFVFGSLVQFISFRIGIVVTEVLFILMPCVVFVLLKRLPLAEGLGIRPVPVSVWGLSVVVGATGWGAAAGIGTLNEMLVGEGPVLDLGSDHLADLLMMILCAGVAAGFCEEALFRGVIQGVLLRRSALKAIVVSALLFALFHLNPWTFLALFFLGLQFGVLALAARSTVPAMLAHFANNTTAFAVGYLLTQHDHFQVYWLLLALSGGFVVAISLFLFQARKIPPVAPALSTVPAGLPKPLAWIGGSAALGGLLLLVAMFVLILATVQFKTVTTDHLEPDVAKGQQVVILKSSWIPMEFVAGDIVAFADDEGSTRLARVSGREVDALVLDDGQQQRAIPLQRIRGKMIRLSGP